MSEDTFKEKHIRGVVEMLRTATVVDRPNQWIMDHAMPSSSDPILIFGKPFADQVANLLSEYADTFVSYEEGVFINLPQTEAMSVSCPFCSGEVACKIDFISKKYDCYECDAVGTIRETVGSVQFIPDEK